MIAIAALMLAFSTISVAPVNPPAIIPIVATSYPTQCERHVLVLYYTAYCPYCQKVIKYLKSIHKTVPMRNLQDTPEAKAELKRIGGKMQVPCLVIDGQALYESNAIIQWLSEHPDSLEPA